MALEDFLGSTPILLEFNDNTLWWLLVEQHGLRLGPN
jgi:hypothetical protein